MSRPISQISNDRVDYRNRYWLKGDVRKII